MGFVAKIKNLSKTEKIVTSSIIAVVVIAVIAVVVLVANNRYLATTMRLLRVEGTVNIEDSTGTVKPVIDNIRFESGDALSTGSDGLASVGLDDTKIVTLENNSRVEFTKQGKQLELNLTQGALFFEVTEKLADDEKYEIKTSNMTVGIRGTSGYVYYSESGLQSLIITDGVVKVTGYNPKTKETKVVEVRGGESVTAYLYDEATDERDSIEFEVKEVSEEELPEFPLQMLAENPDLLEKVCDETGWNKDELLALVEALTNPEEPTPSPDEIIEITDTPTPTKKPKTLVTITPTPTATSSPSAGATGTPAPGAPNAPGSSVTTTPTTTPSTTPSTTPTTTPKPTTTVTVTPTASPTAAEYSVKFVTDGKGTAPATQTVTEGGKATKPANPSATGYTFGGWYKDSACTKAYDFSSAVTSDITLYAKWTHITYTVSFDADGLVDDPEDVTVNHGDTVSPPDIPSVEAYYFDGWYTNNDLTEEYDFDSKVTSDMTLYAGWTLKSYTVSFVANGHGSAPSDQTIYYGNNASKPTDPSASGYAFGGWYTDSACTKSYDFGSAVTSDITLYAKWTPTYTVTFNANGHGNGTIPSSQTVIQGGTATYPAEPSETYYRFGGWYTDPSCSGDYWFDFSTQITGDITLYAKWTLSPPYPDGYNYYLGGRTYNGYDVLVLYNGYTDADYIGWLNGGWVNVTYDTDELIRPYFTITGTNTLYFHY